MGLALAFCAVFGAGWPMWTQAQLAGPRARGIEKNAQPGYSKARGEAAFKIHEKAVKDPKRMRPLWVYDVGETLRDHHVVIPEEDVGHVCEGYAAFMYGIDHHRNVWPEMKSRVKQGYRTAYDDVGFKRQTVRVVRGVAEIRTGEDYSGGGGGGGTSPAVSPSKSPAQKKKRRPKGKEVQIREMPKAHQAKAWLRTWGELIGDKLPEIPDTTVQIFVFPTCSIKEVYSLFEDWCHSNDLGDQYLVQLPQFQQWFWKCPEVQLSRMKGSFKGCSICLGRAGELAKALPGEVAGIRAKYEVRRLSRWSSRALY
jgi:hypothetical protein